MTRIVQLADGEELVSYESVEHTRSVLMDDPRVGAMERRGLAEAAARRLREGGPLDRVL